MKMSLFTKVACSAFLLFSFFQTYGQWDPAGNSTHTGADPIVRGNSPDIEFDGVGAGAISGLQFDSDNLLQGYFYYDHDDQFWGLGTSLSLSSNFLTVYRDRRSVPNSGSGFFSVGATTSAHLTMDGNEIQARNGTNSRTLFLNARGGDIDLLGASNSTGDLLIDNHIRYDNATNSLGIGTQNPASSLHVWNGEANNGNTNPIIDVLVEDDDWAYIECSAENFSGLTIEDEGRSIYAGMVYNHTFDNLIFRTGDISNRLVINENGNVGIGIFDPEFNLQVVGDVDITGELTSASDRRLKKDIEPLQNSLQIINHLNPVAYSFRVEEYPDKKLPEGRKMGLIAQDVKEILPDLVVKAGKTTNTIGEEIDALSVNYLELIPVLIQGIQELQKQVQIRDEALVNMQSELREIKAALNISTSDSGTAMKE